MAGYTSVDPLINRALSYYDKLAQLAKQRPECLGPLLAKSICCFYRIPKDARETLVGYSLLNSDGSLPNGVAKVVKVAIKRWRNPKELLTKG